MKWPFTWENRRPCIVDGVLFIPAYYEGHTACGPFFERQAPLHVEYCSGNGAWIVSKAQEYKECNWVAVERKIDRAAKIWTKARTLGLSNLFIVCGEALTFTTHYVPAASIDQAYVNFPDPWPKARHAKNRLIQEAFIDMLAHKMRPAGQITLVTDDVVYKQQMIDVMMTKWEPYFPSPYYVTELAGYGGSYFDALWRSKGKQIHYLQFVNSCISTQTV